MKSGFGLVLVLLLAACTRTISGNEIVSGNRALFDDATISQVTEGKSTKADVLSAFGVPTTTVMALSGPEQWIYATSIVKSEPTTVGMGTANIGARNIDTRTVTVMFDETGTGIVTRVNIGQQRTTSASSTIR